MYNKKPNCMYCTTNKMNIEYNKQIVCKVQQAQTVRTVQETETVCTVQRAHTVCTVQQVKTVCKAQQTKSRYCTKTTNSM